MISKSAFLPVALACGQAVANACVSTHIHISDAEDHQIRFICGQTICTEAMVDGRWAARYWASDGRIGFPQWLQSDPAFHIAIKTDPSQTDATHVDTGWEWVSADELDVTGRGARHFVVELDNPNHALRVKLHTLLDGTPVLTRWLEITNRSGKPIALTELSPWSGRFWPLVQAFQMEIGYQTVRVGSVGIFEWKPIEPGRMVIESIEGNGFDDPFFILRNTFSGEYFIGHVAWAANWRIQLEFDPDRDSPDAGVRFQMGPTARGALRVIASGETVETPALHLGHMEGDFDAVVQGMHDHIRRSVALRHNEPQRAYRIQLNLPGDNGCPSHKQAMMTEANLLDFVDVTEAIGAEMLLLDMFWYDVYGEWVAGKDRFPRGLAPVRDYAKSKGIQFALQTESEGGRGNWGESRVWQEHPDWFRTINVIDLTSRAVVEYVVADLSEMFIRYEPDLYREEFIPNPTLLYEAWSDERDGYVENCYWRYYEGYYEVWERLRDRFPNLVFQHCANGGTRDDLGNMAHWHEPYTSEAGPPHVLRVYSGKSVALPPELLLLGLTTWRWTGPLDTRLRIQFALSTPQIVTGVSPSLNELTPEHRDAYRRYTDLYKSFIRPILPTSKVYHHPPVSAYGGVNTGNWFAMEFGAPDKARAGAIITRLGVSAGESDIYEFRPRGLDVAKTYAVTFDSLDRTLTLQGLDLVQDGLSIRLESNLSSELLLFDAM